MTTTSDPMRAWAGPALFSYGFRPFFLGGAVWAALAMLMWMPMLAGRLRLPTAFDPVSWHAHEFLFGYLGAVVAGFLLTAVPNWTGRLPIVGWPLAGLAVLWLAGRVAVAASAHLPAGLVAAVDLAFPLALAAAIAREIVAGQNWRNLPVLGLLAVLTLGNVIFHIEAARGDYAAQGAGLRLGLGTAVMMIALIGGRIVPSFTRNWLVKRGATRLPAAPMQRLDRAALAMLGLALVVWVVRPGSAAAGGLLLVAGLAHLVRLARWRGHRTGAEPLVWVLHAGYAMVPLGALALGLGVLAPAWLAPGTGQHLWMAGGIGLMTLAVMTRATLGHTGRPLTAGAATTAIYAAVIVATLARLAAGLAPPHAMALHQLSGATWIAAFGGFAVLYGPALMRPKPA